VLNWPLQHYTKQEGIRRIIISYISKAFGMLPPLRSSGRCPTCHPCSDLHYNNNTLQPAAARPIPGPQRHALARKQVLPPPLHGQQAA
jgi:hypothetical protein